MIRSRPLARSASASRHRWIWRLVAIASAFVVTGWFLVALERPHPSFVAGVLCGLAVNAIAVALGLYFLDRFEQEERRRRLEPARRALLHGLAGRVQQFGAEAIGVLGQPALARFSAAFRGGGGDGDICRHVADALADQLESGYEEAGSSHNLGAELDSLCTTLEGRLGVLLQVDAMPETLAAVSELIEKDYLLRQMDPLSHPLTPPGAVFLVKVLRSASRVFRACTADLGASEGRQSGQGAVASTESVAG